MHPKAPHASTSVRNRAVGPFATIALAIGAMVAWNASAQVLVTDPSLQANNNANFAAQLAKTAQQYAQQVQQYTLQVEQWKQLLFTATGTGTHFSLSSNSWEPIGDPGYLVQANCNGHTGETVAGAIVGTLAASLTGPSSASQQRICAAIVVLQVDKFNKTVDMLNKLQDYGNALTKLGNLVNAIDNLGSATAAATEVTAYGNQMQTEMSNWQANIRADDTMISALQGQQAILAKAALNGGSTSILSQALPNLTFQAAMDAIR